MTRTQNTELVGEQGVSTKQSDCFDCKAYNARPDASQYAIAGTQRVKLVLKLVTSKQSEGK